MIKQILNLTRDYYCKKPLPIVIFYAFARVPKYLLCR